MGEASTGKSCLIKRYCEEKFVAKYISTIGVDFGGEYRCGPHQPDRRQLLQCAQRPRSFAHAHIPRSLLTRVSPTATQSNQSLSTTTK
jgi:GTPase SAR1 family protein